MSFLKRKKVDRYVSRGVQTNDVTETKIHIEYPRSGSAPVALQMDLNLEHDFGARIPPGFSKSRRNVVQLRTRIADGHFSTIWTARLQGDTDSRHRYVAKVSRTDSGAEAWVCRLREEATRHAHVLGGLQGSSIPLFYGLWTGKLRGQPVACILMEDCGDSPRSLSRLPMETKLEVFKQFYSLHKARIIHGNLNRNNILLKRGATANDPSDVRIIDFETLRMGHNCRWREMPDPDKGKPKDRREYDCTELRELEGLLRIWDNVPNAESAPRRDKEDRSRQPEPREQEEEEARQVAAEDEGGDDGGPPDTPADGGLWDSGGGGDGEVPEGDLLGDDGGGADWPQEAEENDVKHIPEPIPPTPANDVVKPKKKKK